MGSSSSPSTSTSSIVTAPTSWIQPYQAFGAQEASRLYRDSGTSPLMNDAGDYLQRLVSGNAGQGYSGPTNEFAMGGSNVQTQVDRSLTDTAAGKYLGANPYLDQVFASASRPVVDNIQSQFSKAGRYGSAANQDVLGRSLGEMSANLYGTDYARERQNQLSAGNAITGYSSADRNRQLQGAAMMNQIYTNNANRQLQGLLFAPQFNQEQSGQGALSRYLQAINGMNVGQSTSGSNTVPYYSNSLGQGIGMATAGLQGLTYANSLTGGGVSNLFSGAGDYLSSLWGGSGGFDAGPLSNYNFGSYNGLE